MTVEQAAKRLLLTPRQVEALESVNGDAFYGPDFYVIALKKYVTLIGLDASLVDQALLRPDPMNVRAARLATPAAPAVARAKRPVAAATWLMIAAAIVATTGVTAMLFRPRKAKSAKGTSVELTRRVTPPPAAPVAFAPQPAPEPVASAVVPDAPEAPYTSELPTPVAAPPPAGAVSDVPVVAQASLSLPGEGAGSVKVARPTWIYVRYGDNTTVERGLAPGEAFVLQSVPRYLAVGSAEDAAVVIAGHTIDNSLYTTNGQLRVGSSQLALLTTQRQ